MEIIKKLLEILNTITDDSQSGVLKKCEEFSFDPNRGDVTLSESFINLNQCRDIIKDAIEKNKLTQFPLTVQKTILQDLESIVGFQSNLVSGADHVVNLVNAIELLYTDIWRFGIHNLSGEVLGYTTKMNQLKEQEVKIKELSKELDNGLQLKSDLEKLLTEIQKASTDLQALLTASQTDNESIKENLEKSLDASQKAAAHLSTIQQNDITATQLLSNSVSNNSEIVTLEGKIREFFTAIESYKTNIDSTSKQAKTNIDGNKKETDDLVKNLKGLQDQIKDQLQKATGFSLFHSFQTRQDNLKTSKNFWLMALALVIGLSLGLTGLIAFTTLNIDLAFYLKLSISIPLIYAIAFCSAQYTRERKLEEEYAFKSNISISLIPYKELVEKLVINGTPQEREQFTTFLIDSISKVFTSPTSKVFGQNQSDVRPDIALKQLSKQLETVVKPFESIIRIIRPS
ncbi:hypothetical protein ACFQ21_13260 [Ohtaekwangia kribbensis]|uniref:Chromosome partition protein Smc n=1 Tax=Ohtaekwangia kribbensis TaxID=688913 RepID=A0ABW3K221_9BACT